MLFAAMTCMGASGQGSFEEFRKKAEAEFSSFAKKANEDFEAFRRKVNKEYSDMVERAWREMEAVQGVRRPADDKPVPPRTHPGGGAQPVEDEEKPYDDVVVVAPPQPQPEPIVPIEGDRSSAGETISVEYLGNGIRVRASRGGAVHLGSTAPKALAKAWEAMADGRFDNMAVDCLSARTELRLCDWAYLGLLGAVAREYTGADGNEATLLTAFLFCQSGYKMRLAVAGDKLVLLFACDRSIYEMPCFRINGELFYVYGNVGVSTVANVCEASFPEERPLSLAIGRLPLFGGAATDVRRVQSVRYPEMASGVRTNKILVDFFASYPESWDGNDQKTRWALYANTPLSPEAQTSLYRDFRAKLQGLGQYEAVSRLLNWVQTGFVYEYDDKVWGGDRAFFPDETLFYPYCDCEDRAILFTRMVRDLLGLKCLLVYYPGHLASAVKFTEEVKGDYVVFDGSRYTICDPTYINAPVGDTMPDMDNATATLIALE